MSDTVKTVVRGPWSVIRHLAIAAALVLLGGPVWGQVHTTLTVLFTSDMHAHVLPFDDLRDRPAQGSVAQVASLVARLRKTNPVSVVLDGGDAIQGTPLEYYAIAAKGAPGEDPTIEAMNRVGYDAAVLGNHEFNFGLDVLRRSLAQSKFTWLAANLSGATAAGLPVRDELILERGGIRIAVLGLTNPNVPHWDPPSHWPGLTFKDPVAVAAACVPGLRERADVVIVVVHSGFEKDLDTGAPDGTDDENYAYRLAQLPGIDLLLTGHTHRNIPPRAFGKTVVAQPGRWAEFVTRVDLDLVQEGGFWKVTSWHGENMPTVAEPADPGVVMAVAPEEARVKAELARPLGELTAPLKVAALPIGDDPSVDLIHAVQLEATGAQLSLAAPLGGRIEFPAGPVTPRFAYALYPYPNTLLVVRLTGSQLKDVLEHAVRGWTGVECAGSGCTLQRDPGMPPYDFDTLEGATYLVDPTAPAGHRIRGLRVGGAAVRPEDVFTVAVNSYRAAGGGGFPHLADAPRVKEIDRPVADLIGEYIARHGKVTPAADDNWAFTIPLRDAPARTPSAQ
jgi:2',3'-cyclic-nucleotide 2'-phosphodiesterase/3'-nucleotidase